ncbi:unnamed protein product [Mytilus edulis]|uniref:Uncharacterized protein n=1 Tax=Mytilus edulis TaxID=6550 RepID=A0A8S3V8Q6_MYTED|nr:unnamed protein product [Mytilus edulis]
MLQSFFETAKHADNEMLFQIADKDFTSNALYHSGCITKYLLRKKEIKAETNENNTGTMYDKAFTSFVESISEEFIRKSLALSECIVSLHTKALSKIARGRIKTLPIDEKVFSLTTCAPFTKPKQRAEPSRKNDVYSKLSACVLPYAETSDLIWVLLRNLSRTIVDLPYKQPSFEGQQIPFWTGFNKQISNISTTYHVVSYPPIIDAKPSDMGTVYTTMKRCADMCQKAGQPFSIQTFDLQLYAVAQQVKWDRPSEFKSHILRLGGFHTLSCFISSIGKIWGDGGLRDLLVDSGVYAAATVDQMLSGKQFNRAVRGLTLLYETLKTLWICSFFVWIRQQKCLEIPESLFVGLTECHESFTSNGRTFDMLQSLEKALNDDLGVKNERVSRMGWSENMTNPFDVDNHPRQLINISTGLHASHDIEDSLLKSVETGRTKMKICVESSLSTDKAANILPAVHALTGCDTTSAIFGFGKKTVFKLIRKSPSKFTNLQNFDKIDFSTSLSAARELISSLYDPKDKFASSHVDFNMLNKSRVKIATCKDTISSDYDLYFSPFLPFLEKCDHFPI